MVKMCISEDLGEELREVEDGFIRSEHYVKGYFFHGVEMRCLKSNVFRNMEIFKFDEIVVKVMRLPILSHISS